MLSKSRPAAYFVVGVRFAVSIGFALAPEPAMRGLFGTPATSGPARAVAAHYAVRDLGLGIGLLRALRQRRGERAWMLAGTAADVVDAAAIVATAGRKNSRTQKLLLAQMAIVVVSDCLLAASLKSNAKTTAEPPQ